MEPKPARRSILRDLRSYKAQGYELSDLTQSTTAALRSKQGGEVQKGWSFFAEKCTFLFCRAFGKVTRPYGDDHESDCG
jgi:hypothetical protein